MCVMSSTFSNCKLLSNSSTPRRLLVPNKTLEVEEKVLPDANLMLL